MIRYLRKIRELIRPIYNSIGFLPSLMCFLFFLLAIFAIQLEQTSLDTWFQTTSHGPKSTPQTLPALL